MTPETICNILWWFVAMAASFYAYRCGVKDGKAVHQQDVGEIFDQVPKHHDSKVASQNPVLLRSGTIVIAPQILSSTQRECTHPATDQFGRCEQCGAMLSIWQPEDLALVIKTEAVKRETDKWTLPRKSDPPKLTN